MSLKIKYFVIKANQPFNIEVIKKNLDVEEVRLGRYILGKDLADILLRAMIINEMNK